MILAETQTVKWLFDNEELSHTFSLPKIDRAAMRQFQAAAKEAGGDQDKARELLQEASADSLESVYDAAIVAVGGYEIEGTKKPSLGKLLPLIPLTHKIQAVSLVITDRFGGGENERKN